MPPTAPPSHQGLARLPAVVLLAAVAALALLFGLGRSDVYNPDEPREVEMSREMHATGDLLVPRLNTEPFLEKPPLFYWLVVAAYRATGGPNETAARLVPAIAGLLTVLCTFFLARALLGESAALLAGLVLLTGFEFFYISRRSMIDMPLTLATTMAGLGMHRALSGARRRGAWLLVAYAGFALALLFKGIVGAGLPGMMLLAWMVARRDGRAVLRLGMIPGILAAFVPVALWVWRLGERLGPEAVREFVLVNNVMRFTGGAAKGHDNPFWYYLPTLLTDLAPWSIVLPFALVAACGAAARRRPEVRDPLLAFALPLLFLSIASTKRGIYLLPIYPYAAILIAWYLCGGAATGEAAASGAPGGAPRPRSRRVALHLLWGAATVVVVAGLALFVMARPGAWLLAALYAAVAAWPLVLGFRAARAGAGRRLGLGVAAAAAIAFVTTLAGSIPAVVNRDVTARPAGETLAAFASGGDRIALYRFHQGMMGGFLFYSERTYPNLRTPQALEAHLQSDEPGGSRALVLIKADDFDEAAAALPFKVVEARRFTSRRLPGASGSGDFLLVVRPLAPSDETPPPGAPRPETPARNAPSPNTASRIGSPPYNEPPKGGR
ncbi:MAG TPA: glycosyltransferase family 39 protein [Dongiaceae bacterium]|nr:glycosyltransferase family 39 protein [Dongiaceae bacterium]